MEEPATDKAVKAYLKFEKRNFIEITSSRKTALRLYFCRTVSYSEKMN